MSHNGFRLVMDEREWKVAMKARGSGHDAGQVELERRLPRGKAYVAPGDRIATFDNYGTLWAEQPLYFQFPATAEGRQLQPR